MKKMKNLALVGAVILAVGATTVTAFASANYVTPAEITAGLTERTVQEVASEKLETGNTYGKIADEAGKLEDFKVQMLENKKAILDQKVAEGIMTQAEADEIIAAIEENQITCDGNGQSKTGQKFGAGFGGMMGNGQGKGLGNGQGQGLGRGQGGNGLGNGLGLRDGSCFAE